MQCPFLLEQNVVEAPMFDNRNYFVELHKFVNHTVSDKCIMSKMTDKEGYHKSRSKTDKVTCRVETCKQLVAWQNYPNHLKNKHPEENHLDLKTFGVITLSNFLSKKARQGNSSHSTPDVNVFMEDRPIEVEDQIQEGVILEEPVIEKKTESIGDDKEMAAAGSVKKEDENFNVQNGVDDQIQEGVILVEPVIEKKSNDEDEAEATMKRIRVVSTSLDVLQGVKSLEGSVKNLIYNIKEEPKIGNKVDTDMILKNARIMVEITERVCQYDYEETKKGGKVICDLCKTEFTYSKELEKDFSEEKIAREFCNLKTSLRKHLKSDMHKGNETEAENERLLETKVEGRNHSISMRIGRLVYYLVRHGRPDTDFTLLVQMNAANGADMGDLNHSK